MTDAAPPGDIRITEVLRRRDVRDFIDVPYVIYRDDPYWVAPLRREVRKLLDRRRNPFFDHGEACYWIAWRGSTAVGRISAQINHQHLAIHKDATGNFGFFEAIDDPVVIHALLETAESWLRARGMSRILGPYSLSMNDEIGILVSGFESRPMVMMAHSPPYYSRRLEDEGYFKAKDVHAYLINSTAEAHKGILERIEKVRIRLHELRGILIRASDKRRFKDDMRLMMDIYNDAWSDNWGFIPLTEREVDYIAQSIRPIVRYEAFLFGFIDGRPEGVLISVPDLNEAIADLGGRIFPFGWAKLLWRLNVRYPKSFRVILRGVRKASRATPLGTALNILSLAEMIKVGRARGVERVELSWILEDNKATIAAIRSSGAKLSKVYRIYCKALTA